MRCLRRAVAPALLPALAAVLFAADPPSLPETPKKPVTDIYHGVKVTDDYRWLEKADDPAVKKWVEAENKVTQAYFDRNKSLPELRKRLKELMSAEAPSFAGLQFRGDTLF